MTNPITRTTQEIASIILSHAQLAADFPELEPIPVDEKTSRFCPVSLRDWMMACRQARVPYVPAHMVGTIRRYDYLMSDQQGPHLTRLNQAITNAQAQSGQQQMLRFDCCSGVNTKMALSEGKHRWHPDHNQIHAGDPRAYDVIYEFPREHIPIWRRPWIQTRIHQGFPVEYRAFVRDNQLQGISSYYPQRSLPYEHRHIDLITRYTRALLGQVSTPFLWNETDFMVQPEDDFDTAGVHCTIDFIVNSDDNVLFLEGGPPHELGAHPCCFEPRHTRGIALSKYHTAPKDDQ